MVDIGTVVATHIDKRWYTTYVMPDSRKNPSGAVDGHRYDLRGSLRRRRIEASGDITRTTEDVMEDSDCEVRGKPATTTAEDTPKIAAAARSIAKHRKPTAFSSSSMPSS